MQTNRILAVGFAAATAAAALVHGTHSAERKPLVPPVQDLPLTITVGSMTLPNNVTLTLDGKVYRCRQPEGCKAFLPGGGYALFLPAEKK